MKQYLLPAAILLCHAAYAQKKDYPDCSYHYLKGHKVSTSECWDAQKRWGRATAYNTAGEVIYDREIRRFAGIASVVFKYYKSGAVMEALWHSAPDAGIQWYNKTTYFSEDGRITNEVENNYDHMLLTPTSPSTPPHPTLVPQRKDTPATARCAAIYTSEMWFINTTPYTLTVEVKRIYQPSEVYTVVLKKGQKAKAGQLVLGEQFDDPARFYSMTATPLKADVELIVRPSKVKPEQAAKDVRRYFFDVRRII